MCYTSDIVSSSSTIKRKAVSENFTRIRRWSHSLPHLGLVRKEHLVQESTGTNPGKLSHVDHVRHGTACNHTGKSQTRMATWGVDGWRHSSYHCPVRSRKVGMVMERNAECNMCHCRNVSLVQIEQRNWSLRGDHCNEFCWSTELDRHVEKSDSGIVASLVLDSRRLPFHHRRIGLDIRRDDSPHFEHPL